MFYKKKIRNTKLSRKSNKDHKVLSDDWIEIKIPFDFNIGTAFEMYVNPKQWQQLLDLVGDDLLQNNNIKLTNYVKEDTVYIAPKKKANSWKKIKKSKTYKIF